MADKAKTLRDELNREGYSEEEKYFYELNRELIEKQRQQPRGLPAVWAVDPAEPELLPDPSSIQLVRLYLGGSLGRLFPAFVSRMKSSPSYLEDAIRPITSGSEIPAAAVLGAEGLSRRDEIRKLLSFAEKKQARLILVSSHGRSGLNRLLLGSFSEMLLEESPIPLWFLPRHPSKSVNSRRALFATDFSEHSRRGYFAFLDLARAHANEIILYNAVRYPIEAISAFGAAGIPAYSPDSEIAEQAAWARDQAQSWIRAARSLGLSGHLHSVVRETYPSVGAAVLEIAERENACLIGVASQSTALERTLFGGVAREVFRAQTHPVWVAGPKTLM